MLAPFPCAGFAMIVSRFDPIGRLRTRRCPPARLDRIVAAMFAARPARP
jgi:hypothetical protein